jgi:hypothetical protein
MSPEQNIHRAWQVGPAVRPTACRDIALKLVVVATLAVTAVLAAEAKSASAAEGCANEAIRAEQGAAALALPDCRAYEMVSPPGSVPSANGAVPVAAANGERFGYYTLEPFPGSNEEGLYLLATRGPRGWSVQNTTPPQGGLRDSDDIACFPSVFYSAELTAAVLIDGWRAGVEVCEGDEPPLVAGEPRGYANLFLRDNEDGSYRLIDDLPQGVVPDNALLQDATPDLSRVVFSGGGGLYEWSGGLDRLVSVLPDGEAVGGTLANGAQGTAPYTHAVSASGETVLFNYEDALYARLHAGKAPAAGGVCSAGEPEAACTVQVDTAQPGATGSDGNGVFMDASEEGSRVFFTDENRLTANATALSKRPDLYEYDPQTGSLTDLTVNTSGAGANVLGYTGASADGSYLYFVAKGVLTGGQTNDQGEAAVLFKPNLYLLHEGVTTFIATLKSEEGSGADNFDWENNGLLKARVSPDGTYLAFGSVEPLTGYNNQPLEPQDCTKRCREIFLYDASENQLDCVSCASSGEPPTGSAEISVPSIEMLAPQSPRYLQRNVLDDGRVFFDSRTPLAPQAVNGEVNVYEYEDGGVSLLSSGAGSGASEFLDASENGEDVFFSTAQGLVQSDQDNQPSIYDARVDGGFPPGPGEAQQTPACESAEACKPPPSEPPAQLFAASTALSGSGNLAAPPVPATPAPPAAVETPVKPALTRAQKLAQALKACARQPRSKRPACKTAARRRFGVEAKSHPTAGQRGQRSSKSARRLGR